MDDIRKLATAVTEANVVHLTCDGDGLGGTRVVDVINRGRRFDPIVRLMSNRRIQSLHLLYSLNFFQRVGNSFLSIAPRLRELKIIHCRSDQDEISIKPTLSGILENCRCLTHLTFALNLPCVVFDIIMGSVDSLQKLETLILQSHVLFGGPQLTVNISQTKIETAEAFLD